MKGQASAPGLAGQAPSGQNVGGAPPGDMDPASAAFRDAHQCLGKLASLLHQFRDDVNSNQIVKLMYEVKRIELSRRKEIADKQADQVNGGSNPLSAVGNINAMGVSRGY